MMHVPQKIGMKYTVAQSGTRDDAAGLMRCYCRPPSLLAAAIGERNQAFSLDFEYTTPISPELYAHLGKRLGSLFPRTSPFSLVLLHAAQVEPANPPVQLKPRYYHAPPALLQEVIAQIRRSIRRNDYILTHEGVGTALLFPGVDERGICGVVERVYHNISQIETDHLMPQFKRETVIAIGVGSYPAPSPSIERLLFAAGTTAYHLSFPSRIEREAEARASEQTASWDEDERDTRDHLPAFAIDRAFTRLPLSHSAPYMQLPECIPERLKQIVPYDVALAMQCAPVGRNHHSLTVAMADPQNVAQIRALQEATGLTIFPVSCDTAVLQTLLAEAW